MVALPHPSSRIVFAYLQSLVLALDAGHGRWCLALDTDPDRRPQDGERVFYLRPETAMECLDMLRAAASPAEAFVDRSHAHAAACDEQWRDRPILALEAAIDRELHALAFLAELLAVPIPLEARRVAESGFAGLRRYQTLWENPAALLSTLELPKGERDVIDCRTGNPVLVIGSAGAPTGMDREGPEISTDYLSLHQAIAAAQAQRGEALRYSAIVLMEIAGNDLPAKLLPWLLGKLAPGGVIRGVERRAVDLEPVLGALTWHGAEDRLTFSIEDNRWVAFPLSHWTCDHVG